MIMFPFSLQASTSYYPTRPFSADLKLSMAVDRSIRGRGSKESEPVPTRKLTMDHISRTAVQNLGRSLAQKLENRRPKPDFIYALRRSGDQNIRFFKSRRLKFWKLPNVVLKRSEKKRPKI